MSVYSLFQYFLIKVKRLIKIMIPEIVYSFMSGVYSYLFQPTVVPSDPGSAPAPAPAPIIPMFNEAEADEARAQARIRSQARIRVMIKQAKQDSLIKEKDIKTIVVKNESFVRFPELPDSIKHYMLISYFSYQEAKEFFKTNKAFRKAYFKLRELFFKEKRVALFPYLIVKDLTEEKMLKAVFSKLQRELQEAFGETINEKELLLASKQQQVRSKKKLVLALNHSYRQDDMPTRSERNTRTSSEPLYGEDPYFSIFSMRLISGVGAAGGSVKESIEVKEMAYYCALLRKDVAQMESLEKTSIIKDGLKIFALKKINDCSHKEVGDFWSSLDPVSKLEV
jgi:hypothetical protein